ncbi:hypothetical protein [Alcanivorax sp. 1008]|uniref:hypothetical protein n=1 Tax=Alcanivorax sp. 1008 TaxID=2816853 RepID=UPI001D97327E|nr:hypothetical protein [Alcanivorax sp. 1008]MCC1496795.1 hypothetical protein [Alcanivorax sp. 1008]
MDAAVARLLMEETHSKAAEAIDKSFGTGAHLVTSALTTMLIREVLAKFGLPLRIIACRAKVVMSDENGEQPVATDDDHLVMVGSGFYFAPLLGRMGGARSAPGRNVFVAGRFPGPHQADAPFRARHGDLIVTFSPKEDQVSWLYSSDADPKRVGPLVRQIIAAIAA